MFFIYPIDLIPGTDSVTVVMDDGSRKNEPVTAVYKEGDAVIVETVEKRRIRCDPGLKVQGFRPPNLTGGGGSSTPAPAPTPFNSLEWP